MAADKIKRSITWIRKSLEIIEKTTNPGTLNGEIIPTLDVLGWERLITLEQSTQAGAATSTIFGPITPPDILRYVVYSSVEHAELAGTSLTLWIEVQLVPTFPVGVLPPLLIPGEAAGQEVRYGNSRPLILRPGDRLLARSSPATGIGVNLRLRQAFVDLPIGEYIRGV